MKKIGKFGVFKFEGLDDFIHIYDSSRAWTGSEISFRGQASLTWGLSSNIERLAADCMPELRNIEKEVVRDFKKVAHHYIISEYPINNSYIEWLALIQHHGGPTRLLDFTKSLFIASYFATENLSVDGEIWTINNGHLELNYSNFAEAKSPEYIELIELIKECNYTDFNYSYHPANSTFKSEWVNALYPNFVMAILNNINGLDKHKGIIKIEPERLNKRIQLQKGLFYLPVDITSSFEENLKSSFNISSLDIPNSIEPVKSLLRLEFQDLSVTRLIIPKELKPRIRLFLENINLNAQVLFPDLEGLTKSLKEKVSNFKINRSRTVIKTDDEREMWKEFYKRSPEIEEYLKKKNDNSNNC